MRAKTSLAGVDLSAGHVVINKSTSDMGEPKLILIVLSSSQPDGIIKEQPRRKGKERRLLLFQHPRARNSPSRKQNWMQNTRRIPVINGP